MIEGVKIDLTSKELYEHLMARVKYHEGKARAYQRNLDQAEKLHEGEPHMSADPRSSYRDKIHDHEERAALFGFFADHLVVGEVYRLSEQDFSRLELVKRYW